MSDRTDEEAIIPPALDAYVTAKPDEPTWTAQGGDPLGGPLLRVWAAFNRIRAGIITPNAVNGIFEELRDAANKNPPENERDAEDMLIRSTQTEQVSWTMDAYFKGDRRAEEVVPIEGESLHDAAARIDLHDLRVRAAQKLASYAAEVNDLNEALNEGGLDNPEVWSKLASAGALLVELNEIIEPRRIMKKEA